MLTIFHSRTCAIVLLRLYMPQHLRKFLQNRLAFISHLLFIFSEVAQLEAQKHQLDRDNQEHKKEKLMLENQLEMERMKVEAERKRVLLAHEQLRDKVKKKMSFEITMSLCMYNFRSFLS